MRWAKIAAYYAGGFVLIYTCVFFIVWYLPGTLADVLSDSEINLEDLKNLYEANAAHISWLGGLKDFLFLDWGQSVLYREDNFWLVMRHFQITFFVSTLAVMFVVAVTFMFFKTGRYSKLIANIVMSIPALALFPLIIFLLCYFSPACPAGSSYLWIFMIVAALAQAFLSAPRFYREMEWEFQNMLRQRFVLVLRGKGIKNERILWVHVLTNILPPFFSLLILTWLGFLSGSILLEALFDIPGVGSLTLEALKARDIPLIFCVVLFLSLLHLVALNLGRKLKRERYEL